MARPAQLLGFVLCSALLVPAVQLVGGWQPLQAARSGGAARDRVLPKHPVPDGLRGVGDRFLNGSDAGYPVTRQEPVPLNTTQIPEFFGAGDTLPLITTPELWDLDPLTGAAPQGEPLPLGAASPQDLAQADGRLVEAMQLFEQGNHQFNRGQFESAITLWEQALQLYRATGNRDGEGGTLLALGDAYRNLERYQEAINFLEQGLMIFREARNTSGQAIALLDIGRSYIGLKNYSQAISILEQALALAVGINNPALSALVSRGLGTAYLQSRQYQRAIDSYGEELIFRRAVNDRPGEGSTLGNLGNAYLNLEDHQQAISFLTQSLVIVRELNNLSAEIHILERLGVAYDGLGNYQQAIDFFSQSLVISRQNRDLIGEARALGGLGNAHFSLGKYSEALTLFNQQLSILRAMDVSSEEGLWQRASEGRTLGSIANIYAAQGNYQRAINFNEQSLAIFREIQDPLSEGRALGNLGGLYFLLGSYQQSIDLHQQSLIIFRQINNQIGEGNALGNLGVSHARIGNYQQALDFHRQHLVISRELQNRALEGQILGSLGDIFYILGNDQQAIDSFEQSLLIASDVGSHSDRATALNRLAVTYERVGLHPRSMDAYQESLSIRREIGDRAGTATTLSNIGRLLNTQDQPELAITFLKASVDIRESIRSEIRQLDRDLQQAFTDTIAADYRLLAELLLQSDRVLEAQEILDLLKLQELDDYELRNVRGTDETEDGIAFWPAEQAILDRFYAVLDTETDLQTFFASADITEQVAQLQRNARGQNLNPEQLAKLQDNLQQAGNAALLYPLILDDRLELVLVTTSGLVRRTVPLDRVELNRVIAAFRTDLTNRFSDPRPNAQQLYDWLIAPLVADLEEAGAATILYAADGQLRYIPLAALYDGDQWLTDRFTINHITAASLTDFSQAEAAPLNILAGAFPAQDLVIEVAGEERWFSGLPFAQVEVENLQANLPGTQAFFSAGFNRQAIEPRLADHTVIHLATHGTFRSGHPNDSFILLGDGDRITLFDLDQWQLPNASLVVLSACETAVSGPELGTGEEILGFGYQIQRTGARAAIASLWTVSDGGTQTLMDAFYLALQNGYPMAEALRRSQRALIADDLALVGGEGEVRAIARPTALGGDRSSPLPGYSHPYYWAPFILIGNGL